MTRWLLCDYGNVISTAQPAEDLTRLAGLAGLDVPALVQRYWAERDAYDRSELNAFRYWARLLGACQPKRQLLKALVAADIASWTHLNTDTLAATARAAARGYRLALLSNAPVEVARAIEQLGELAPFQPRWFSCDLRATKPDPAVYAQVKAAFSPGDSVTFLDDRAANVAGAQAAGLQAVVFEDTAQIDSL